MADVSMVERWQSCWGDELRPFLLFANAFLAVVPFSSLSRHLICSSPTLSFISPAIFVHSLPAFFTFLVLVFLNFHFFKS